jgi:hypothetical protein
MIAYHLQSAAATRLRQATQVYHGCPACKSAKHASTQQAPLAHHGELLVSTVASPKQSTRQALELRPSEQKKVTSKSDAANHWSDEVSCLSSRRGTWPGTSPKNSVSSRVAHHKTSRPMLLAASSAGQVQVAHLWTTAGAGSRANKGPKVTELWLPLP